MRVALVRNNIVEHVIIVGPDYRPPKGVVAIPSETANPQDTWNGQSFETSISLIEKQMLMSYASNRQMQIMNAGISVVFRQPNKPIKTIVVDTTVDGRANLAAMVAHAQIDKSFTVTHMHISGGFQGVNDADNVKLMLKENHVLTADEIIEISKEVQNHIAQTWAMFGVVANAIDSGHITTLPQIERPEIVTVGRENLRAWPVNLGRG